VRNHAASVALALSLCSKPLVLSVHLLKSRVVVDVISFDILYITSETSDTTIHSENMTYFTIVLFRKYCASSDVSVRSESESFSLLLLSTEDSLLLLSEANVNSHKLYVFSMNNNSSPPYINTSMQEPRGRGVLLLLILDLSTRWGSGQCHAPAALYPWGKHPRYPLDRRLGGSQFWSEQRG
jgi:hypothetical protein